MFSPKFGILELAFILKCLLINMHILIFLKNSPNMKYDLMFQIPYKHRTFSYMVYYFFKDVFIFIYV